MSGGLSVYTGQPSFSVLRGRSGFSQTSKNRLLGRIEHAWSLHQRKSQCQLETGAWSLLPGPGTPLAALGSLLASVSSLRKKLRLFGPSQAPGFCLLHPFTLGIGQENQSTGNQ